MLKRYLASIPSSEFSHGWTDVGVRQIEGPVHEVIHQGFDPKTLIVFSDQREVGEWSSRETHLLWSLGNILRRTLTDRLRIEQSSVYSLQVNSTLERVPFDYYNLEIVIPCLPGGEAQIALELNQLIDRFRESGPTPAELQKEIEFQRAKELRERFSNADWLWKLELIDKYQEGYRRLSDPDSLIDWLNPESLRNVAQRHWRTDSWVRFDLLPES